MGLRFGQNSGKAASESCLGVGLAPGINSWLKTIRLAPKGFGEAVERGRRVKLWTKENSHLPAAWMESFQKPSKLQISMEGIVEEGR